MFQQTFLNQLAGSGVSMIWGKVDGSAPSIDAAQTNDTTISIASNGGAGLWRIFFGATTGDNPFFGYEPLIFFTPITLDVTIHVDSGGWTTATDPGDSNITVYTEVDVIAKNSLAASTTNIDADFYFLIVGRRRQ